MDFSSMLEHQQVQQTIRAERDLRCFMIARSSALTN